MVDVTAADADPPAGNSEALPDASLEEKSLADKSMAEASLTEKSMDEASVSARENGDGEAGRQAASTSPVPLVLEVKPRAPPPRVSPADVGVQDGQLIDVLWDVEMEDGSASTVWWEAQVDLKSMSESARHVCTLVYAPGGHFEQEEREVFFSDKETLWDMQLEVPLDWRFAAEDREAEAAAAAEGEDVGEVAPSDADDDAGFAPDTLVKARLDSSGEFFSAVVVSYDAQSGTYDLQCDDQTLVQEVPRDLVERVAVSSQVAEALGRADEPCVDGIDAFFATFVQALTSGAMFSKLTPAQKAVASEKVRLLRPHFEAELQALREERGNGATVTAEDIQAMLPRVMARSKGG